MRVKKVKIYRYGGLSCLQLCEDASEPLAPGQVRIQVKASGVNFADLMMRLGLYPEAPPRPFTPGYEVAGLVTEIHPEQFCALNFQCGDRVLTGTLFGGYASEVIVAGHQVRPLPTHLSFEQGAGLPVAFLTAWIGLCSLARIQQDDEILIPSATGEWGLLLYKLQIQPRLTLLLW